jgi:methionine-rich copper-binding protein CopC
MTQLLRRGLAATVLMIGAGTLAGASPARHLELKRTEPARDSTVQIAPTRLSLYYTAKPMSRLSTIKLEGPKGPVTLGAVTLDTVRGAPLIAPITGTMTPGVHTVTWLTASADGHPIRGTYTFTFTPKGTR